MSFDFYAEYRANKARILREMRAEDRRRREELRLARMEFWGRLRRVAVPIMLTLFAGAIFLAAILKDQP